jgi:hypothetical protein
MSAERERVAGFGRLEDGLLQAGEWYRWGAVRQRAALGHGPGGLQRRRQRVGLPAARPRPVAAYRWGEDGLAGFCDIQQRLCLALALWNGGTRS